MDLFSGSCANRTYCQPKPVLSSLNGEFMVVGLVLHKNKNELAVTVNGYDVKTLLGLRDSPCKLAFQLNCRLQKIMLVHYVHTKDNASPLAINHYIQEMNVVKWFEDRFLIDP